MKMDYNWTVTAEGRIAPQSGPVRTLGWNVPAEELQYIPEHWLQFQEPNPAVHYLLGTLYIFFAIIALLGNGLVIWIFSSAKSLRTPSNMFVVNLAICDFCMMLKTPIFIYNSFNTGFALGHTACTIFGLVGTVNGIGGGITNAAIAYDRYSTITRPLDGKLSRGQVLIFLVLIWLYVLPWALMPLLGVWGRYAPEGFLTQCTTDFVTDSEEIRWFTGTMFVFAYVLPLTLIIYFYSKIVGFVVDHEKALRKQARKMNVESLRSGQTQQQQSAEVRIAKAALGVCFMYILAWTPYAVAALIGAFGNKALLTPGVTMLPACFAKSMACLDPYVYAISHPRYRLELQKRLPWLEIQEKEYGDAKSTTTEVAVNTTTAN